jgi:hypothetical protein
VIYWSLPELIPSQLSPFNGQVLSSFGGGILISEIIQTVNNTMLTSAKQIKVEDSIETVILDTELMQAIQSSNNHSTIQYRKLYFIIQVMRSEDRLL